MLSQPNGRYYPVFVPAIKHKLHENQNNHERSEYEAFKNMSERSATHMQLISSNCISIDAKVTPPYYVVLNAI